MTSQFRNIKQRVKTARGRKVGSTKWLRRHINDPFVLLAKQHGYRSRSAFKLIEIDDKFKILKGARSIIDLGAAPGGWLQVAKERSKAEITGIDLKPIDNIEGITLVQGDFLSLVDQSDLNACANFDVIMSDMASSSSGEPQLDHIRIIELAETVLSFALDKLNVGGSLVIKILQGKDEKSFVESMRQHFESVKYFKPKTSYEDSSEMYVVGLKFKKY